MRGRWWTMMDDERWTVGRKRVFPFGRGTHTHTIPRPFSRLWHGWLWKVAPVRQGCRPADLLRAAWIQKYASTAATTLVYAPPWPSLVPRFVPTLPFALDSAAVAHGSPCHRIKLSPPRHLHKSIKSVLVEFEPSSSRARYLPIRDAYRRGRKCSTDVRLGSLLLLGGKVVSSSYFLSSSFFI